MAYTNIDDPSAYFQTLLYTGNSSTNIVTNTGNSDLQPDLIWGKCRSTSKSHFWYDSTRGSEKRLSSNSNAAEVSNTNGVISFNSNGFRVDSGNTENDNGESFAAWQWKCNAGTTSTNTDGDITSTVQANTDAGFSIVTYTGNTSNNQTVGHGLGAKPSVIIIRNRTRLESWRLNHQSINNGTGMIRLNSTDAYNTTGTTLMNVAPTSSVFNVSTDWSVNGNYPFVAWCWAEKQGYSKFGTYVGNGNENGTFVYLGFKPAFLMMKETSSAGGNWVMFDGARDPHNVTKHRLFPNLTNADNTTRNYIDLLSNGFKMRNTDADHNQNGETMIYMAFAESSFVTSGGIPTTAR